MEDAQRRIASQCGGPYAIVSEDRLPIGTPEQVGDPDAPRIYEYRVTYECTRPAATTAESGTVAAAGG